MKSLRIGVVDVTMSAGAGTGNWGDPALVNGTPGRIVLDDVPDFYEIVCTTRSGGINVPVPTLTANGVTLAGDSEDAGVYRVWAVVRGDDFGI